MARPKTQPVFCTAPNCNSRAKCKSLCDKHYVAIHMNKPCVIADCDKPMRCNGFCDTHYRRVKRTGSTHQVFLKRSPGAKHKRPDTPVPDTFPRIVYVAWAAGFFDGEGTATLSRSTGNGNSDCMFTRVSAVNREKEPLILFQSLFGGHISKKIRAKGTPSHHSNCWTYQCTGVAATIALAEMLPFLHVKHEQAKLLIENEECREIGGKNRRVSDAELQRRTVVMETIRHLNRRGRGNEP